MSVTSMTGIAADFDADDELAERIGDSALAALLRAKPHEEQIPAAVWWLTAETLRTSVAIRRLVSGSLPADPEELETLLTEAALLTDAALAELAETTGAHPTPVAMPGPHQSERADRPTRPAFGLHLSVLFLARMLVSHRETSPQRLANTLAAHLRALAGIHAANAR